jgi:hypothetical protein
MTPSTSQPKPVESKPSTATPAPSLAERLTPPPAVVSAPAKPVEAKPADAGFKPVNPFASTDAKPASTPQPEVANALAPDVDDDDKVLTSYAAGSAPAQPSRASSISRTSSLSPYSDPFTSSSGGHVLGIDLPKPPVEEQADMLKLLVTDERLEKLWQRIDVAEDKAIHDNHLGPKERSAAMDNIRGARNLILGGRPNYEDALRYVVEVEADLMQVNRLRSWSMTYGTWLFVYNMLWLFGLTALWVNVAGIVAMFPQGQSGRPEPAFFITILCGGLGGVTGALRSMWVHIAKDRDFDPQHMWWYIINPILGCVLAIFGYWTVQLGLVAVSGEGASGNGAFVLYVLGFLVGFQQNVAYQLVEQAIKMFFKRDDTSKSSTAGATAKPPSTTPEVKPTK